MMNRMIVATGFTIVLANAALCGFLFGMVSTGRPMITVPTTPTAQTGSPVQPLERVPQFHIETAEPTKSATTIPIVHDVDRTTPAALAAARDDRRNSVSKPNLRPIERLDDLERVIPSNRNSSSHHDLELMPIAADDPYQGRSKNVTPMSIDDYRDLEPAPLESFPGLHQSPLGDQSRTLKAATPESDAVEALAYGHCENHARVEYNCRACCTAHRQYLANQSHADRNARRQ